MVNVDLYSAIITKVSNALNTLISGAVVKVRGARGAQPPCFDFGGVWPPLLESEPSLPTAGPKLLNSIKKHNVRRRINKF